MLRAGQSMRLAWLDPTGQTVTRVRATSSRVISALKLKSLSKYTTNLTGNYILFAYRFNRLTFGVTDNI